MSISDHPGGIIHTYQKFDPVNFPSPTAPPPDVVSPAFEHLLHLRQHAPAHRGGTGPRHSPRSEPDRRAGTEPRSARWKSSANANGRSWKLTKPTRCNISAKQNFHDQAGDIKPPSNLAKKFNQAVRDEQLHDLERLWYRAGDERGKFARQLLQLVERLGEKYQVDELAGKYEFTGRQPMTVPEALEIKARTGNDRRAAQTTRRGDEDGPDRHHRHGGAVPNSPSRATSRSSARCSNKFRITCARSPNGKASSRPRAAASN